MVYFKLQDSTQGGSDFFEIMAVELKTHSSYRHSEVESFFGNRGWQIENVKVSNVGLVVADEGAALECIDGRFGQREIIKKHGPKIPGGSNAIAALKTGGDPAGFNAAALEVRRLGFRAGTHKHCGFFELWENGGLKAIKHRLELPKIIDRATWISLKARHWGGKHFHLPGEHEEEALTFNPFVGTTSVARKDRFSYDHWVMPSLGIHRRTAMLVVAETVEPLSPHRRIEILIK